MTRINTIDPQELTDQHLLAEYREIFMVGPALRRSLASPNWSDAKIPATFTLNKGHVMFFYNKGKFLHERYRALVAEMKRRGNTPDPERKFKRDEWPDEYYGDWEPTEESREIIRERIALRISQRPGWYRYNGKQIDGTP